MMMGRGPGSRGRGMAPQARVKNPIKVFMRIFGYSENSKWLLVPVVIFIVLSSLAQVAANSFMQSLIDDYLTPLTAGYDAGLIAGMARILLTMGVIYVTGAVSSYVYSRIMLNVSVEMLYNLRTDLFRHMETQGLNYFDTNAHGDLMSRYTNDVDAIRQMLSNSISSFISSAITVVSVFVMMVIYSWHLTLVVVVMVFVMVRAVGFIAKHSGSNFVLQQSALGKINGYIEEMIEGQKVVKVFSKEDDIKAAFADLNGDVRMASAKANTYANILMPIIMNLNNMTYAMTAIVGGILTINGVLSLGTVLAFMQFARSFGQPISQISQQLNSLLSALAGADRIFQVIDLPSEPDGGVVTIQPSSEGPQWVCPQPDGSVELKPVRGGVVFDHVTFGYVPNKIVLDDISLYAKPGQKIAFVGSTGAGKTTITNLINRFYEISEGSVTYDGIEIDKIKKPDLRRSMAMVLQDTHLFTGTVMENIRYGKLDATDDEVMAAARLANADGFIRRLPEGYQTVLTADGANLSQGQRQLLSIARAAVADPPVLILDEATSSIDTRTEALVEKGMDQLMENRTVFVIAHRLSTVRNANAIIVLEHGKIIERGDHDDLIAQRGKYYQLYTGAFELA